MLKGIEVRDQKCVSVYKLMEPHIRERRTNRRRAGSSVVSQRPAIIGASREPFLQLHLFQQEVCHQTAKARVLELELSNLARLFALGRTVYPLCISYRPWSSARRDAGFSPAMIRHHTHSQGLGNVAVQPSLSRHVVCHCELRCDFRGRMSLLCHYPFPIHAFVMESHPL
jgi:hypothetical protein